jgi:hypothetical protein
MRVDIRKTARSAEGNVTDEDGAEIFVRINNQGARLGRADFVFTLLCLCSILVSGTASRSRLARDVAGFRRLALHQATAPAACAVAFSCGRL